MDDRNLTAMTPDRRWLVVSPPPGDPYHAKSFFLYAWKRGYGYDYHASFPDTGQDAHDVLAQYIAEHGDARA